MIEVVVTVAEPDTLHPSGFENVTLILHKLGKRAITRSRVFFENDGTIYTIISILMGNVFTCSACRESIFDDLNCHSENDEDKVSTCEFNWIVPLPELL